MKTNDIRGRLIDIEARIHELKDERCTIEVGAKWTPEAVGERIRKVVETAFGKGYVKLALLKVNSEYNDEGYNYSPNLILVDSNYDEIDHHIDPYMFMPTDREQHDYYDVHGEDMELEDIKVKF